MKKLLFTLTALMLTLSFTACTNNKSAETETVTTTTEETKLTPEQIAKQENAVFEKLIDDYRQQGLNDISLQLLEYGYFNLNTENGTKRALFIMQATKTYYRYSTYVYVCENGQPKMIPLVLADGTKANDYGQLTAINQNGDLFLSDRLIPYCVFTYSNGQYTLTKEYLADNYGGFDNAVAEAEKQHQISTLPKLEKTSEETETKIAEYRAMMSTESGEIFNGETMVSTPNKAWVYKLELTEDALIVHGSLDRTYEGEKKPTLVPDGMHTFKIDQNSDVPDYVKNVIKREGNNPSAGGFSLRAAGNTLLSVAMAD